MSVAADHTPFFSSFRDPENSAFSFEQDWFRLASPKSAAVLRRLRESNVYEKLLNQGVLVAFEEIEGLQLKDLLEHVALDSPRPIANGSAVFAVENVENITFPWEWTTEMFRRAATTTLKVRSELLGLGLDLKDASAFNIQFRGMRPVLVDLGSIEEWGPSPTWHARDQFVRQFINPLAASSSVVISPSHAWKLGGVRNGLNAEQCLAILPMREKIRPALLVLIAASIPREGRRPASLAYSEISEVELCKKANYSLIFRLNRLIQSCGKKPQRSTWASYGERAHYSPAEIGSKLKYAEQFVDRCDLGRGTVLDIGGNDGLVARHLSEKLGLQMVVVDNDPGAMDVLSATLTHPPFDSLVMPVIADVTCLDLFSGVSGEEFPRFLTRFKFSGVLCHAVVHHLVITQGLPMKSVVNIFARFKTPLQIEFVSEHDQKVKQLISHINRWTGDYSVDGFLEAMSQRFSRVSVVGKTSEHRVMIEAYPHKTRD